MMTLVKVAPWILLAGMAPDLGKIRLEAPPKATLEEVTIAAQNLAARCKSYGYKGVRTRVSEERDKKWVEVECDSGFTAEMVGMIRVFGAIRGASIEIRFPYERTEAELEQYQPGADTAQDRAPRGARWYRCLAPKSPPLLLLDSPAVVRQDILITYRRNRRGVMQLSCDISRTRTREIERADLRHRLGTPYLILDGRILQPIHLIRKEIDRDNKRIVTAERASFFPYGSGLREVLLYPLPVTLTLGCAHSPESAPENAEPHAQSTWDTCDPNLFDLTAAHK